jgi:hypothetical protein
MKVSEIGSDAPVEPEDLFEVANLYPSTTALPMTVWVSPRGNAEHDVRVRVNITDGNQLQSPSDGKPTVGADGGDLRRANRDGSISPLWC